MRSLLWLCVVACAAPTAESAPPREIEMSSRPEAAPSPAPPSRPKGVITRGDLTPVLDRGVGAFLQHVDVAPRFAGGRFQGWRVTSFFPGDERFAGVDVRPGDVVVRVNGRSVEKPDQLAEVWQSLRDAPALEVELLRDGVPMKLRWPIEP